MKIPGVADRQGFYDDIAQQCLVSRSDRISQYERLRCYYLFGCDSGSNPAIFNKIYPQIDLLVSFLFAAETARFGIQIDSESKDRKIALPKIPALTRRLNSKWHRSNADIQTGLAVQWALVFDSMFIKLIQRGRNTYPYLVDPHSFGVLREDMPFLDDQEAFVHTYTISANSLKRILDAHPRKNEILAMVSRSLKQDTTEMPAGVQRIVMSQFPMGAGGPGGPGQVTSPYNVIDGYRAKTADERVEMRELWVWDDDANDYRVATLASGNVVVYDRENFYLPGEQPFTQICPNPAYDYFWGHSEVDRLTQLQDARETRMEQIIELLNRQVKPPSALRGQWNGIQDETNYALQVFGASISSSDPTASVEQFAPTVPSDTFTEIREYDSMFNEIMGLSNVVQGKGESGVRSKGHAAELARLGSSRIRKRAFTLEDGFEKIGLHYLKLMQQHDPETLLDEDGKTFIAEQFTKDYTVKVDGHSSSPIFTEDQKELAYRLFESHAIDRSELIEMVDPPNKQVMLEKLKVMEKNEQAAAEKKEQAEAQKGLKSVK